MQISGVDDQTIEKFIQHHGGNNGENINVNVVKNFVRQNSPDDAEDNEELIEFMSSDNKPDTLDKETVKQVGFYKISQN